MSDGSDSDVPLSSRLLNKPKITNGNGSHSPSRNDRPNQAQSMNSETPNSRNTFRGSRPSYKEESSSDSDVPLAAKKPKKLSNGSSALIQPKVPTRKNSSTKIKEEDSDSDIPLAKKSSVKLAKPSVNGIKRKDSDASSLEKKRKLSASTGQRVSVKKESKPTKLTTSKVKTETIKSSIKKEDEDNGGEKKKLMSTNGG
ncbi:hypothetical protein DSO57_1037229 [Entomophthora muscae]|uniref:Uncharacterized protein n=2 Tax=Entomophthora muscae TaxID=34485 RepID=A0ACC2U8K1_9FUNG|nr:hypothetical protein DSO57_1037023 [Entomophthora muscae]KAJ9083193.1 hypothetical protein DSO57_1037229 [Entomophthora muscae]